MSNRTEEMRQLRAAMMAFAKTAADADAVAFPSLFSPWSSVGVYAVGDRCEYRGRLYKCRQGHTAQADWTPLLTPALWEAIDVEHAGTREDPVPAVRNMAYQEGIYYLEGGRIYRCTRSTGQAVSHLPSELVGLYFETV